MAFQHPPAQKEMERWNKILDDSWVAINEQGYLDKLNKEHITKLKQHLQDNIRKLKSEVAGEPIEKNSQLKELNKVSSIVGEKLSMISKGTYKYNGGQEQPAAKKTKLPEAQADAGQPYACIARIVEECGGDRVPPPPPRPTPMVAAPSGSLPTVSYTHLTLPTKA